MFSTQRHSTVFANHVFSSTAKQTNRHLGTRPTQIENATKFNKQQAIRQTLLRNYKKNIQEKQSQRQITQVHKIINQQKE